MISIITYEGINIHMDEDIRLAKLNGKYTLQAAFINGVCLIIGALIGIFSLNLQLGNSKNNNDTMEIGNPDLQEQLDNLSDAYKNLILENSKIQDENSILQDQINAMQSEILEYNSLVEENAYLKEQVQKLENELQIVKHTYTNELETQDSERLNNNDDDGNSYIQITMDSVKIRSAPETSSLMIGGALRGDKILLVNTVDGTDGYKWYEVSFEDQTGYIRSDLARIVE